MGKSLSDSDGPIVRAQGLLKRFGTVTALDRLDLTVERGEVHGFLGPNGAGKSTTIRAVLGQLRLDEGVARVFGLDAWADAVRIHEQVAYVPGDTALWPGLSGGECIDILGHFQGSQNKARRNELIHRFDLDPTRKTRAYSKGNRQKVALIAALAADTDLLLFDEPTSGLDPLMEEVFQECVREAHREGRTVFLSSHILDEVEALCDTVSIIRRGRIITSGTLSDLRRQTLTHVKSVVPCRVDLLDSMDGLTHVVQEPAPDGVRVSFRVTSAALATAVGLVVAAGPKRLHVAPPSLDELFLSMYRDDSPPHDPARAQVRKHRP
jgi:ABC-2 type transport system ATP-binding protein